jgi:tRNA nucleotidyltransferase (CCA-adding enzyme)
VRLLRLARFAARFADFRVADETLALCRSLVEAGEVDALVPERVWKELSRGLMEAKPSRLFDVLRACGALSRLLPEVDRLWGVPQPAEHHPEVDTGVHLMMVLDTAAALGANLAVRFACLVHDLGKGDTPPAHWPRHHGHEARGVALLRALGERLRVPTECRALGEVVAREHGNVHRSDGLNAAAVLRLLERCDALRRPERFGDVLLACECDWRGRAGFADRGYPPRERLAAALARARGVATEPIADAVRARGLPPSAEGPAIAGAIRAAREHAIAAAL